MTPEELQAAVARQLDQATGSGHSEIESKRADLFERYMGEPYGDETKYRSSVVSSDVSDTVEWIMPELMDIFTSGERVVDFDPLGPDDEERAEQEADVTNHVAMRLNPGFMALYSWFKTALIQKNGYVKWYWDRSEKSWVEEYENLTPEDLMRMQADWVQSDADVEVDEIAEGDEGINIKVRVTEQSERLRMDAVAPEEILVSPQWSAVSLADAPFVAHRPLGKTASDLVAAGYDREQVMTLTDADGDLSAEEHVERFSSRTAGTEDDAAPTDETMREVDYAECYIRADMNGDGIAELIKVTVGGSGREILKWADGTLDYEEVHSIPIATLTPMPVPFRHYGRSVAELVTDLQRIKTVLIRQMLDNIYLSNNPTREIAEDGIGENTIADLLVERPGKLVRTAAPGMYQEHTPPQFMGQMLPAIEYIDTLRENRTGVTRYNQGVDANSLNKTATGVQQIMTAAQKKIMLIARVFAETGVKELFRGLHDELRRNASKALTIRLRGRYVQVDPRHWRDRADVAVSVALGAGTSDMMLARLMAIAEKQEQHLLNGSPLVTLDQLHHTYSKIVEKSGFKNPDAFFLDPATAPPQPQQPPEPSQAQMVMQIEQMKAQADAQHEAAKLQFEREKEQFRAQIEAEKLRLEDDRKRDEVNIDAALKLIEINSKANTAYTVAELREMARMTAGANRPGPNDA